MSCNVTVLLSESDFKAALTVLLLTIFKKGVVLQVTICQVVTARLASCGVLSISWARAANMDPLPRGCSLEDEL